MTDYNGVIKDLIAGKWVNPEDKRKYGIPIKKIEIDKSLDGKESLLISQLHPNQNLLIVSDQFTPVSYTHLTLPTT